MVYCRFCGTHGCDDCMFETRAHEYFKFPKEKKKESIFKKGIYPIKHKENDI